jgi:phage terminase large subunit
MKANDECENYLNNLYLILRKEWIDLRDSTLHDWDSWIGRPVNGDKNVIYPNGSVLMFRHGDDLNALKNVNLGGALMVQAEEMSEEDLWFLKGRMRRQEGTRQIHLECNYDGHNWIYRLFNEKKLHDGKPFLSGKLITTNTFDNEKNLPPDYIEGLKKLPDKIQRRHLYGSDEDMEGQVWDEFKEGRHLVDPFEVPIGWDKIISLDHGVTNPTACLWGAIDWDGKLYIIDEHYEAGKTVSYHAEQINKREYYNIKRRLIDPSCAAKTLQKQGELHSIIDEYRDNGLSFLPADNTVLSGINRVNEAFKNDKLFIFKTCANTIREIQGYKWKRLKYTDVKNQPEEPLKKDDHACDALRYMVMSRYDATKLDEAIVYPDGSAMGKAQAIKRKGEYAHQFIH